MFYVPMEKSGDTKVYIFCQGNVAMITMRKIASFTDFVTESWSE